MKKTFSMLMKTVFLTALLALSGCGEDERAKEEAELDAVSASLNGTLVRYTGSLLSIETEEGKTLTLVQEIRLQLQESAKMDGTGLYLKKEPHISGKIIFLIRNNHPNNRKENVLC